MKTILTTLMLLLVHFAFGQSGNIQGTIIDENGESLMFATITIQQDGRLITGMQSDLDGNYVFDSLAVGVYDIEVSYVGYPTRKIEGVSVFESKNLSLNIEMKDDFIIDCPIQIPSNLINFWDTTQGETFSAEDIRRSAFKN